MTKNTEHWDRVKKRTLEGKVSARIKSLLDEDKPLKIIIYNNLCPGDLLVMTASIEAIHQQYPGKFLTDIRCFHPTIYANNPYITSLDDNDPECVHLWTTYPLVNKTNQRPIHFMEGYLDWFRMQLDIDLILETNRPHIYLTQEEKNKNIELLKDHKKYWIVNAGWKNDYTIKRWPLHFWQEVVNHFKNKITFVQIGLVKSKFHNHPLLDNVVSLVNKTSIRELMVACYHAQGGMGTITCIQHMFAAYQKPYVVTHGAREPTAWTGGYHTQKVLSNIGTLECCKLQSCWRSRVVALGDGDKKDKRLCALPMKDEDGCDVAKCMWNIKPRHVIEAIETYYEGEVLSYE